MARRVIWAHSAEADLEVVIEYIHRDFPAYAAAFMVRALEAGRSLGELAERGRMVPELRDENKCLASFAGPGEGSFTANTSVGACTHHTPLTS